MGMTIADMFSASQQQVRQNIRQRIFAENQPAAVSNAVAFALLGMFLWGVDWAIDAEQAGKTIVFRIACLVVLLSSALLIRFTRSLFLSYGATYLAFLVCETLFINLLSLLEGGLNQGVGEFLYFFLGSVLLGGLYPFYLNLFACLAIAAIPLGVGMLVEPNFHLVQYGAVLFPAAAITILIHWRTRPALVEVQRLRQQIDQSVLTDPITGLLNYLGLANAFQRLIRLGKHKPLQQFMLVISIDGYDEIEAAYGEAFIHSLRGKIGEVIEISFRGRDITASLDRDEFVCILQNISRENCFDVAERIRQAIADTRMECPAALTGFLNCTVSIGIGAVDIKEELKVLINKVRIGTHQARSLGGNQCSCV